MKKNMNAKEFKMNIYMNYKDLLFDLMDAGVIDAESISTQLIKWISEDECKRFVQCYEYDELMEEDGNVSNA